MIGLEPATHLIDGRPLNIGAAGFPVLPTWMDATATWQAPSTTEHPDPSRLAATIWVPSEHPINLDVGSRVRCWTQGDGTAVIYHQGIIDSITHRTATMRTRAVAERAASWTATATQRGKTLELEQDDLTGGYTYYSSSGTSTVVITLTTPVEAPSIVLPTDATAAPPTVTVDGSTAPWTGPAAGGAITIPGARAGSTITITLTIASGQQPATIEPPIIIRPGEHRTVEGRWYELTSSSYLAALGRTYIGDEPWPVETLRARAERISTLARDASGYLIYTAIDSGVTLEERSARARDIDRRSALEMARLTAAAAGGMVIESPDPGQAASIGRQIEMTPYLGTLSSGMVVFVDGYQLTELPASAVRDAPRIRDASTIVTASTVRYHTADAEGKQIERTYTAADTASAAAYGPAERSYDTDLWVPPGDSVTNVATGLIQRSQRLVSVASKPETRLDGPARIPASRAGLCKRLWKAVQMGTRHGAPVRLTEPPEDLVNDWRVIGGRLTFGEHHDLQLNLEDETRTAAQPVLVIRAWDWKHKVSQHKGNGLTVADMKKVGQ